MIKPLRDLVHIAPLPKPTESTGGILLAMQYQDDAMQYRVLATGPKVSPDIAVGDRVLAEVTTDIKHTFEDGSLLVRQHQIKMCW